MTHITTLCARHGLAFSKEPLLKLKMKTAYNHTFNDLLKEYNLSDDFSFSVDIPTEVRCILDDEILLTDLGITLKSFNGLYAASAIGDNQSLVEDNENHFHVDFHINPPDNKKAFMLAVKTLVLLATKFQKANIAGVRFSLSFQTPELGKKLALANNIDDDEHYISDRLSFHMRRPGEEIITVNQFDKSFCAILILDI